MTLSIAENTMEFLIKHKMYHIIEDLIAIRSMLKIDYNKLRRDE